MLYMMAIYALLSSGALFNTSQVSTAGQNYTNHSVLPTDQNINQPPIPRKVPVRRTSFGRMSER